MQSFWLCDECLFAAAYEDHSTLSHYRTADQIAQRITALPPGLARLIPVSADFDSGAGWGIKPFSSQPCDGCGSPVHGQRHQFTRL
ncbi:hypothetical protein EDB98_113131 [Pseudomonas fluorescens]|nr:hypothetical protein [Pseudomonas fluorescens]TCV62205.1 hypothetical protein EDB98_113131 [Pseudomonas fluorescens]